jgi:hypothetical protein
MKTEYPGLTSNRLKMILEEGNAPLDKDVGAYLDGTRYFGKERKITIEAEKKLKVLLKQEGYSKEVIAILIRINNNEIFDLPYDRREDLTRIHPGRMISILEKKKCVQKIKPPAVYHLLLK